MTQSPSLCVDSTPLIPRNSAIKRTASAVWNGDLKSGHGNISTQSGVLEHTQYSFTTRFEQGVGTNPEELIAAAHAGSLAELTVH